MNENKYKAMKANVDDLTIYFIPVKDGSVFVAYYSKAGLSVTSIVDENTKLSIYSHCEEIRTTGVLYVFDNLIKSMDFEEYKQGSGIKFYDRLIEFVKKNEDYCSEVEEVLNGYSGKICNEVLGKFDDELDKTLDKFIDDIL